ncbi:MAG: hypothetical protein A3E80_00645 [Chlamydiae bacterium RIFCSPHIGHO2_12_FULL_49_9]|nr:MAG: hypothetical protein A3E80_00645 [Chlamydiae bacterium RIFCSPHIGHO2_12_FULL_49_9]
MKKHPSRELPIRSKLEMAEDVAEILRCLHTGRRSALDLLLQDLKTRSIYFEEQIQQDVLVFAEQVQFQYDYDPWHKVTREIEKAADKLIEDLGLPSKERVEKKRRKIRKK